MNATSLSARSCTPPCFSTSTKRLGQSLWLDPYIRSVTNVLSLIANLATDMVEKGRSCIRTYSNRHREFQKPVRKMRDRESHSVFDQQNVRF